MQKKLVFYLSSKLVPLILPSDFWWDSLLMPSDHYCGVNFHVHTLTNVNRCRHCIWLKLNCSHLTRHWLILIALSPNQNPENPTTLTSKNIFGEEYYWKNKKNQKNLTNLGLFTSENRWKLQRRIRKKKRGKEVFRRLGYFTET